MTWLKRIGLFLMVNILVVTTLSIITSLLGIRPYLTASGIDYGMLAGFCLVWGMGGAFISLLISKKMAKWTMGLQVIDPNTSDPAMQDLVQTVHRLSRAAGLPKMPEVAIYDAPDMNAFATGPSRSNSLVAVSTGLMRGMDRRSLEGVLGHEVAHIANGDMVTLTLIQGVMNAFVMFAARALAYVITNFLRSDDEKEGGGSPFVQMMIVFALEILFGILAAVVVAWFSRYREFRADSGGARLAGRDGMIAALKALQRRYDADVQLADQSGSRPEAMKAFNISGKTSSFMALFSSHPPLEDRIRRLEMVR